VILLSGGQGLKKSIDINDEDHPIAGQVMGSEPETMTRAALILHNFGYDVIDLNFACPVKKIKNRSRGGHMLFDVPRAISILRAVRDALDALMANRTTIIIAHRLSTIRTADMILVLEHGQVIESGSHVALTARRGAYARLVERQMSGLARA